MAAVPAAPPDTSESVDQRSAGLTDSESATLTTLEKQTNAAADPWLSVELARRRISRYLLPTILIKGRPIPRTTVKTFYKCDHMRRSGSYKERGGLNALLCLSKEKRERGVIAASAGNHAQALAYHGGKLGIPVTMVMPVNAPIVKRENCKNFGANVILHGKDFSAAKEEATRLGKEKGLTYVNGFDDPDVIAGAGTCGLEILDQLPSVDVIIVPVGGGGLLAGIALAVKKLNPAVRVIGVESERCANVTAALKAGKPVYTPVGAGGTVADGLAVNVVGANTFAVIREYVDSIITVRESYITRAILHMLEVEKMMVEGGGATALAAIMSRKLDAELTGKNVVTVITGGNIDITLIGRVINQGLYASGRLHMFDVAISNRVGGLAAFMSALAKTGASVKAISQETPLVNDINATTLHMEVETMNSEHWTSVVETMKAAGFVLKPFNGQKYSDVDMSKL
ncbi:Pyridoxal-phosphate dependent enzyme [Novymonas esmeraldas]|uniref:Serine racemase n=1 Tax=Novymonas esmeraldas TaxID=1808958 RepID=A0AAW0EZI7_9TRYP